MTRFFSRLRYSFGNEDWRTEEEALDIQPTDHVLCITASGDRPLNLLMRECQKMVCIDANPIQNHLLQLKAAAMQVLDYQDYLAFLGAKPSQKRKIFLQYILPFLDHATAQFWSKHKKMIEKGVLYQGGVEKLTNIVAKVFKLLRGKKVKKLFSINNIEEQRKFVREEWDSSLLRKVFNLILNSFISRIVIEDPGLANFGADITPGNYIYDRIAGSLDRELAKKNLLLSLILKGEVSPEAFSPYLTEVGTQVIKQRTHLLDVHTTDILTYLESLSGPTFDVFSLSDVPSYLTYPNFVRLLEGFIRTAKPGARFCLRQFLSSYEIPQHLQSHFMRDHSLEKRLERLDNCFIYRFMVGTITSTPVVQRTTKKKHLTKV